MKEWRLACASAVGTSHLRAGTECQDYCLASIASVGDEHVLLACVADGAGSGSRSAEGARIACETFMEIGTGFIESGQQLMSLGKQSICDSWIECIRQRIISKAAETGSDLREFATTFLAVILSYSHSVYIQVGDGAIVTNDSDTSEDYTVVFWPQHGEYANTTNFITDSTAVLEVEFEAVARPAYRIAMFSDGLERLLLDLRGNSAASKTIEQLMMPLLDNTGSDLNACLTSWLQTKPVNDRTDDDKSLILAARHDDVPRSAQ